MSHSTRVSPSSRRENPSVLAKARGKGPRFLRSPPSPSQTVAWPSAPVTTNSFPPGERPGFDGDRGPFPCWQFRDVPENQPPVRLGNQDLAIGVELGDLRSVSARLDLRLQCHTCGIPESYVTVLVGATGDGLAV